MTRDYMRRTAATEAGLRRGVGQGASPRCHNPKAQYGDPVTTQDVISSRTIAGPLKLLMCSPIGDGAAALVLATARGLDRLDADPVRVLATSLVSGRDRRNGEKTAPERAARRAYAEAGIEPTRCRRRGVARRGSAGRADHHRGTRVVPGRAAASSCCARVPPRLAAACPSTQAAACSPRAIRSAPRAAPSWSS